MGSITRSIQQCLVQGVLLPIRAYRYLISPCLVNHCRFYPSCSEYAQSALQTYGLWYGGWLMLSRLLRCHPFHAGGYDPLPTHKHMTIHHPTKTGVNGQILVEFGAKNYRKSAAYGLYVSILRKFFPPKSTKYGRLQRYTNTRKIPWI
jgi:uncharacterized protein